MLIESMLSDIFTSNWPFCVHQPQYFSKSTYSEIRACFVCIPTVSSIVCEGNIRKIKQKREGNKRRRIRERQAEDNTGSVTTKDCFLEQHYSEEARRKQRQVQTFYQDWGEQVEIKKTQGQNVRKVQSSELNFSPCGEACLLTYSAQ